MMLLPGRSTDLFTFPTHPAPHCTHSLPLSGIGTTLLLASHTYKGDGMGWDYTHTGGDGTALRGEKGEKVGERKTCPGTTRVARQGQDLGERKVPLRLVPNL